MANLAHSSFATTHSSRVLEGRTALEESRRMQPWPRVRLQMGRIRNFGPFLQRLPPTLTTALLTANVPSQPPTLAQSYLSTTFSLPSPAAASILPAATLLLCKMAIMY